MNQLAVSLNEAVRLSGIGRTNLYKIFKTGKIKPRKAGKRTLVLISELTDYLNSLPVGGSAHDAK